MASAREPTGISVGGNLMLEGPSGLVMQFHPGNLVVEVVAGMRFTSIEGGDDIFNLELGGGLLWNLVKGDDTHLQLGARVGISFDNAVLFVDVPLRVEHWFSDRFSMQPQVGIVLRVDPGADFGFDVGRSGFFGGASFVFYLDPVGGGSTESTPQPAQPTQPYAQP